MRPNCDMYDNMILRYGILALSALISFGTLADTYTDSTTGLAWSYVKGDDGRATITGVSKARGDLRIPAWLGDVGVSDIGTEAFKDCVQLLTVEIEGGISSLGERSFNGCVALRRISVPSSVNVIGTGSFVGCDSLKSAKIPGCATLSSIGLTGLQEVEIAEGASYVCDNMMHGCGTIKKVTLPQTITRIGDYAFAGCGLPESFDLPDSVNEIGMYAFLGCSAMKTIRMPASASSIGEGAFKDCKNLVSIRIPSGISRIETRLFENCVILKSVEVTSAFESIGPYAFSRCANLKEIALLPGLKIIDERAFRECGITSVRLPTTLMAIGVCAFESCSNLKEIEIPSSMPQSYDGWDSYYVVDGVLTRVTHSIRADAFSGTGIQSIRGPAWLQFSRVFSSQITNVVISGGESVVAQAYKDCVGLESVTILEGVARIEDYAFFRCERLKSVTLPKSLKTIGACVFNLSGLETIEIPDGVTTIGFHAFSECAALTSANIPSSVTEIGAGAFEMCQRLENLSFQAKLERIEARVFWCCRNIKEIDIPAEVNEIGAGAFAGMGLTSVTIPGSVRKLGDNAFLDCKALTSVLFEGDMPEYGKDIFDVMLYHGAGFAIDPSLGIEDDGLYPTHIKDNVCIYVYSDADGWPWLSQWEGYRLKIIDRPCGVTVSAQGPGTVTGGGLCEVGASVSLVATPGAGYKFSHWEYSDGRTSTENPLKLIVQAHIFLKAIFELKTPDITSAVASCDGVSLSWCKTELARSYKIYRRAVNSGTVEQIAATTGNEEISYFDRTCTFGVSYEYWVESIGEKDSLRGASVIIARADPYVVTFDPNGGECPEQTRTYKVSAVYGELPIASRTGYLFLGWFSSVAAGSSITKEMPVPSNTVVYAHWKAITYSVRLCGGAGIGDVIWEDVAYGDAFDCRNIWGLRPGSRFFGWADTEGGELKYPIGTAVSNLTTVASSKCKLYAVWGEAGLSVGSFRQRYPWNGLVDVEFAVDGDAGLEYPLMLEVMDGVGMTNLSVRTMLGADRKSIGVPFFVQPGSHRIIWNAGADLPDGYRCENVAARLRHAMSVGFNACGGTCEVDRRWYALNDPYGDLPKPMKSGCVFRGWYSDAAYKDAVTGESLVSPSVAILYAKWEEVK